MGITGTSRQDHHRLPDRGRPARRHGSATGLIGTVETRIGEERIKSERTTPEATDLQALFAVMRERGVRAVAMEVSSHALVLGRVDGVGLRRSRVFTNLSPEHLDFHSDMEDYFQAKAQLFTPHAQPGRRGQPRRRLRPAAGRRMPASRSPPSPPRATRTPTGAPRTSSSGPLGSRFTALGPDAERIAAGLPAARPVQRRQRAGRARPPWSPPGSTRGTAADGVAAVPGVPGRLERVDAGQPYLAVVDYAHKTDAVESVLRALRKVTDGRLHIVLGCGGDRDQHKRGPMGAACAAARRHRRSSPSDNPRSEDPLAILAAMLGRRRRGARPRTRPRSPSSRDRRRGHRGGGRRRRTGRHRPGRRQGARAGPGHRRRDPPLRRPRGAARRHRARRPRSPSVRQPERRTPTSSDRTHPRRDRAGGRREHARHTRPGGPVTGPVVIDSREVRPGGLFAGASPVSGSTATTSPPKAIARRRGGGARHPPGRRPRHRGGRRTGGAGRARQGRHRPARGGPWSASPARPARPPPRT